MPIAAIGADAAIGIAAITSATATALAARPSKVGLDPNRVTNAAPPNAPITPPRLKASSPRLAVAPNPAPASIAGTQLKQQ